MRFSSSFLQTARGLPQTLQRQLGGITRHLGGLVLALAALGAAVPASAQGQGPTPQAYSTNELVSKGHSFFGSVSRGLALSIEKAVGQWGQPNGYILGQEGSGAFVGGLRYGEGVLYTRNAGDLKVFWQGPSVGWDFGGDGARTMVLVYNLRSVDDIFRRFGGISGSAYVVAGFGMTALGADGIVVVPIRSGVGVRLGANLGYLKFTPNPTWNPF
ncbi:DUF1134 domain-containing protein [Xanthobacter sp. DSM 14520]